LRNEILSRLSFSDYYRWHKILYPFDIYGPLCAKFRYLFTDIPIGCPSLLDVPRPSTMVPTYGAGRGPSATEFLRSAGGGLRGRFGLNQPSAEAENL
ncbi:MAG: hypothetical protein SWE60_16325, partial [Thermodesulfobacteriota bacterium]|nr:hypothetical protein [Thermodesulfobacteriota bacterium]